MAQATLVHEGRYFDYTPTPAVAAGQVVAVGNRVLVAPREIAAGTPGSLAPEGVWDVVKDSSTFAAGAAVYWDADGNPVDGTAGSGAATTTASGNKFMGYVTPDGAADASANTVRVSLRSYKEADADTLSLSQLSDVADTIAVTAGKLLVANGSAYDDVSLSGDVTMDGAGAVTLNAAHQEQTAYFAVADLAAGADLSATVQFALSRACTLVSVGLLAQGAFAGIDNSNTMVVAITDGGGNTIVSKTYNTTTQPTNSALNDLGSLDATHKLLDAGETVSLAITNGTTANPPAMLLVIRYIPTNA